MGIIVDENAVLYARKTIKYSYAIENLRAKIF